MNRTRLLDRFSVHVFFFFDSFLFSVVLLSVCLLHQLTHFVNFKYVWDLTCPRAQVKLFNISKTTRRSIVRLGHLFIACNLTNEHDKTYNEHTVHSQLAYLTCRPFHSASNPIQPYIDSPLNMVAFNQKTIHMIIMHSNQNQFDLLSHKSQRVNRNEENGERERKKKHTALTLCEVFFFRE